MAGSPARPGKFLLGLHLLLHALEEKLRVRVIRLKVRVTDSLLHFFSNINIYNEQIL